MAVTTLPHVTFEVSQERITSETIREEALIHGIASEVEFEFREVYGRNSQIPEKERTREFFDRVNEFVLVTKEDKTATAFQETGTEELSDAEVEMVERITPFVALFKRDLWEWNILGDYELAKRGCEIRAALAEAMLFAEPETDVVRQDWRIMERACLNLGKDDIKTARNYFEQLKNGVVAEVALVNSLRDEGFEVVHSDTREDTINQLDAIARDINGDVYFLQCKGHYQSAEVTVEGMDVRRRVYREPASGRNFSYLFSRARMAAASNPHVKLAAVVDIGIMTPGLDPDTGEVTPELSGQIARLIRNGGVS